MNGMPGAAPAVSRPGRKVELDLATTQYLAAFAVTVAAYVLGARLGLRLALTNREVTTVWPPTGVAVAALLLGGMRLWPAVAAGAFMANLLNGASLETTTLVTIGDTLAPVMAALLLTGRLKIRIDLEGVGDVLGVMVVGGLGCMILSATLGTSALVLSGALHASQFWVTWPQWWIGDSMGVVLLAPAILLGAAALRRPPTFPRERIAEGLIVLLALLAVATAPFFTSAPISFLVFPPVLWAAFRFGRLVAAGAVVLTAGLAIAAAASGGGPYRPTSIFGGLIALQAFNGSVALVAMVIAAITEQAIRSRRALEQLTADLERQVAVRTAELRASNEAKTEYLSRISHELRTPLTAIIGYSDLLALDESRPDQLEKLGAVNRASEHLLSLINDVLDITSIETGTVESAMEPIPVAEVIREATNLVAKLAGDRGIDVRVARSAAASVWVMAERTRLRQVLINLISNAIKYTASGGTVRIAVTLPTLDHVRVSVTDSGPGIAPELIPRLFTPFERLGAERSSVPGSGLGLALCRGIIEAMGGKIGVDSEVGRGSSFWFDLERATAAEKTSLRGRAQRRPGPRPAAAATVLLVEDDPATRQMMSAIFERRPELRMVATDSGASVVELARRETPDVILLDLHLPDLGGEQVLDELKRDPETDGIPVIVVSADATTETIARVYQAGARQYLTKPVHAQAVLDVLDGITGSASAAETVSSETA
jgi:signal transduction histidine kinase/ActR/RegA family two-component response regulator